jgi:hypothetical protein
MRLLVHVLRVVQPGPDGAEGARGRGGGGIRAPVLLEVGAGFEEFINGRECVTVIAVVESSIEATDKRLPRPLRLCCGEGCDDGVSEDVSVLGPLDPARRDIND